MLTYLAQILYAKLVLENLYAQTTVSEYDEEVSANRFPKKLSEVYVFYRPGPAQSRW